MTYNMKPLASNTIAVGGFHRSQVSLNFPYRSRRARKATFPRVQSKGEGDFVDIAIRWEPVLFWRSKYYLSDLPKLWKVVRHAYNVDGELRDSRPIEEVGGVIIDDYEGEVFPIDEWAMLGTVWAWVVNATYPDRFVANKVLIEEKDKFEKFRFVFPKKLNPRWWRPAILMWWRKSESELIYPLVEKGYIEGREIDNAYHSGLGSHWAPALKGCNIEFQKLPTRDEIERVFELWKDGVAFEYEDWSSTMAGRWRDKVYLRVVSVTDQRCVTVLEGAYGYKNGGKARPISKLA